MQYGTTPFQATNMSEAFHRIATCRLEFPRDPPVSVACKELIGRLLTRVNRLGSNGAQEVKQAKWLRDLDWNCILSFL